MFIYRCAKISAFALMLMSSVAVAQWRGFPLSDLVETSDWNVINEEYHPIAQIYSAAVERATFVGTAPPTVIETWQWYAGVTNETNVQIIVTTNTAQVPPLVITNNYIYTNTIHLTNTITTTNALGPVEYTYKDEFGIHNATGFPYVTRYFMSQLDTAIETAIGSAVAPNFVDTNLAVGGSFNDWFLTPAGPFPQSEFPRATLASFMYYSGIGYVTNNTGQTNASPYTWDAYWTKSVAGTSGWLLAETHYSTNTASWRFNDIDTFDSSYYTPIGTFPIVQYQSSGGTNYTTLPITLTVTGFVFNITNQVLTNATETVIVASTNTPLTKYWYDITGLSSFNSVSNGDSLAIMWTNNVVQYGDWAYQLSADMLDERWIVLNNMRWTKDDVHQNFYGTETLAASLTSTSLVSYTDARTKLAGELNNPANWNPGTPSAVTMVYSQGTNDWRRQPPLVYAAQSSSGAKGDCRAWLIATNIQHSADVYVAMKSVGSPYYDFIGNFPNNGYYALATNMPEASTTNRVYSGLWVNPAENISVLTNFPTHRQSLSGPPLFLFKWDGPNGLVWK